MTTPDSERIAVTGLGCVTPLGNSAAETWPALLAGQSGVAQITAFDPSGLNVRIAAEVKGFDPATVMDRRDVRRTDRFTHLATAAAREAVADARLDIAAYGAERVGVLVGSGVGGLHTLIEQLGVLAKKGARSVSPFTITGMMLNGAAGYISIVYGLRGPSFALASACATGSHTLGEAAAIIRRGQADAMLAGASEAGIVPLAMAAFDNMGALADTARPPEQACRPFDSGRCGFVVGEGAGMVVLERLDLARARGAHIYAEFAGYGASSDAFNMAAPIEDGSGAEAAMRACLADAGLPGESVGYINAHGTGTTVGDVIETRAIKRVFGEHAYRLAVSSTKSMTGHLLGAAGAIEAVFCLLALRDQVLPPTINLENPDPECDLDYVPGRSRPAHFDVAMSNSFGLGGHNAAVLFRRLP